MRIRFTGLSIAAILLTTPSTQSLSVPTSPPPAAVLDHLALYVADLDRSTTFYKTIFGFAEVKSPLPIARWLDTGNGTTLHIVKGRPAPVDNAKWDHFAISCPDMPAMIARLDARNIPWSDIEGKHAVQTRADGVQQIFVRDPDGYWVEINDKLKAR